MCWLVYFIKIGLLSVYALFSEMAAPIAMKFGEHANYKIPHIELEALFCGGLKDSPYREGGAEW